MESAFSEAGLLTVLQAVRSAMLQKDMYGHIQPLEDHECKPYKPSHITVKRCYTQSEQDRNVNLISHFMVEHDHIAEKYCISLRDDVSRMADA